MNGQNFALFLLLPVVGAISGWVWRARVDAGLIDQLRVDITRFKVQQAVLEERSVRIDEMGERYVECNELLQSANAEVARLRTALEVAENEFRNQRVLAAEREQLQERNQIEFGQKFDIQTTRTLEVNNQRLTDMAESRLNSLLLPLREQIGEFKKRVEDTYDRDSQDRHQLKAEITQLKSVNERISKDAINLTNALRGDNKSLGNWGELVLERVLESAGLERGREYEREVSFSCEAGKRLRPDVLIHLPGGRDVVIDAKVSIKAFEKALAERGNVSAQKRWMRIHVRSIRKHFESLSAKEYERIEGINSLDFVVLFVPVEAAFQAALEHDSSLYKDAFDRDIVLVGPASLMVTCRTIQNVWRAELQNKNALLIARKAGDLVDKFAAFSGDLDKVGESLTTAAEAYEQAKRRLSTGRGNLLTRARNIQQLGAVGKVEL